MRSKYIIFSVLAFMALVAFSGQNAMAYSPMDIVSEANPDSITAREFRSVHVYPNPAATKVYVQIDEDDEFEDDDDDDDNSDSYTYSIGNIFGKRKKKGVVKKKSEGGSQVIEIDVTDLSRGAYVITIKKGNRYSMQKLIVQ